MTLIRPLRDAVALLVAFALALAPLPAVARKDDAPQPKYRLAEDHKPLLGRTQVLVHVGVTPLLDHELSFFEIARVPTVVVISVPAGMAAGPLFLATFIGMMAGNAMVERKLDEDARRAVKESQPHLDRIRASVPDWDCASEVAAALDRELAAHPWLGATETGVEDGGYEIAAVRVNRSAADSWLVAQTRCMLSPDFRTVRLYGPVMLFNRRLGPSLYTIREPDGGEHVARWLEEPIYRGVADWRSPPLAQELLNDHEASAVRAEYDALIAASKSASRKVELAKRRDQRVKELMRRTRSFLGADERGFWADEWATDGGRKLKLAVRAGAQEYARAIVADLTKLEPAGSVQPVVVVREER